MALIENSKGRSEGSGYERLFGNQELGHLLSRVQATVISSGNELEKLVVSLCKNITDVDSFLADGLENGTFLISKAAIKHSSLRSNLEPDLLIFKIDSGRNHCYIVELKDGDNFDTKKAEGERSLLQLFQNNISSKIRFTTSIHVCCFNQLNKDEIVKGFKKKITKEMAMTGLELCEILGLDYTEIVGSRVHQQLRNVDYFIEKLLEIPFVKDAIVEKLKN
jgi:hypothetical protein